MHTNSYHNHRQSSSDTSDLSDTSITRAFTPQKNMEERISGFCIKTTTNGGNHHGGAGTGTKCGRWNPTTEQVKVLTDLFRSGLRTPSTDQIQKISTQLSFYGKIESKNVFYWFQNHKARERQKRRKVSMDENDFATTISRRDDKFASSKRFVEFNANNIQAVGEAHERVLETLQLFPLNSLDETEQEKLRLHGSDQCREINAALSYGIGPEIDHPPLDLRLSFM